MNLRTIALVTQARLKELLSYDPDTGIFARRKTAGGAVVGSIAGFLHPDGYRLIRVDGDKYAAHRLAWLYVYGEYPKQEIDHINLQKDDNRIANLRLATRAENVRNCGLRRDNTTGFKGVAFHKASGRYVASANCNGRQFHLGYFDTAEEAFSSYRTFVEKAHGGFARPDSRRSA